MSTPQSTPQQLPQQPTPQAAQSVDAAQKALHNILSHPQMSLEAKVDTFKKLRMDNKITEAMFQSILAALAKFHPLPKRQTAEGSITPEAAKQLQPASAMNPSLKRKSPDDASTGPMLGDEPVPYPTSAEVKPLPVGSQPWPGQHLPRPSLTAGLAGPLGTSAPAIMARGPEDVTVLLSGDIRHGPKKNPAAEQSMRRTIQDLVSSIDPNVKIAPEVEDLLLEVADEFIDSVANFSCRIAKHRGGDTLETKDLQLHLERNHNIRIPGFASDETRLSISQSALLPQNPTATTGKKSGQGTHMTLRSARLNAVSQAKRDGKLM